MALYEVSRTDLDAVRPGEFVSALVIARGNLLARAGVAHLLPEGASVKAEPLDVNGARAGTQIVHTLFDERDPDLSALSE